MEKIKELLSLVDTVGGHLLIALGLLLLGLCLIVRWQLPEGKELFVAMMAVLTYAMKASKT